MTFWQEISVVEAKQLLQSGNVLTLDTRDMDHYLQGHLPNALHLDAGYLRSLLKNAARHLPILIYCYHGISSRDMAQLFADFGFTNCYSLEGGYAAWYQDLESPWPVNRPPLPEVLLSPSLGG